RYFLKIVLLISLAGAANAAPHATTPVTPANHDRWRIAYVESGDYADYPITLGETADGLALLGWLEYTSPRPESLSGPEMWRWLAENTDSEWLEFVPDAYWRPGNFDSEQRAPMREAISNRLHGKQDIDLIIAMGTWAGQDLRQIGPPVP